MKRFAHRGVSWLATLILLVAVAFPIIENSFSFADTEGSEASPNSAQNAQDPFGKVTFPIDGEHVGGTVDIRGTVRDKDIKSYKVLVTTKISDNIKCADNEGNDNKVVFNTGFKKTDQNLKNEVLASFNTTTVSDGQYFVYLCVRDDDKPQNQVKVHNGPEGFIVDNTAPVINAPDVTAYTNVLIGTTVSYSPTASDAIDGNIPVICNPVSGSLFPIGTTTVNCSATDTVGNTSNASFNVTVILSDAPPVLFLPPNFTGVQATSSAGAGVNYVATANDAIDGPVPVTCSPASGSTFAIGTTTVNCSATDNTNQTSFGSFTIEVVDTLPPTLSLPPNISNVEATGPGGAVVGYGASATDVVDGNVNVNCAPASGSTFAIGTTTVNCSATDSRGNTANGSFTVQVVDTTAPVISGTPADMTIEATSPAGAVGNYTNPTATDIVDGSVPVTCVPPSGSTFPLGITTVTCTATDAHGNSSSTTFTVSVVDTTPPFLSIQNPTSNSYVRGLINVRATASDPGSGINSVTFQVVGQTGNISMPIFNAMTNQYMFANFDTRTLPDGTYDFSFTANNNASGTSNFLSTNVTVDNTRPTASIDSPVGGVHVNGSVPVVGSFNDAHIQDYKVMVTNTDTGVACRDTVADNWIMFDSGWTVSGNVSNALLANFDSTTVTDGQYYVFLCARDIAGNRIRVSNSASGGFNVDNTAPVIQNVPLADVYAEATGPGGAVVTYTNPTAIDAVEGPVPVTCVPPSGSTFPIGASTVVCTATDSLGNSTQASFNVFVVDTTAPVISGTPADMTIEATSPAGAVGNYTNPTATDIVDGSVPVTCALPSGSTFPLGTTTVTCTATDAHGNSSSTTFTVSVVDTIAPAINGTPASFTLEATGANGAVATYINPTATDAVDTTVPVNCAPVSGSTFAIGVTTVTCTATDSQGNTSTTNFTVTVVDTTKPILVIPGNMIIDATSASGAVAIFTVSASDIVDGSVPVTCSPASGATFAVGTTTVNCSATDSHGNTATSSFVITVNPLPPVDVEDGGDLGDEEDTDGSSDEESAEDVLATVNNGQVKTGDEYNSKDSKNKDNKDDTSDFYWLWWLLILAIVGITGYSVGKHYNKES